MRCRIAALFSIFMLALAAGACTDDVASAGSTNTGNANINIGDDSCTSNGDCTPPEVCVLDPVSGELSCDEANGTRGTGESCTDGSECASGICLDGQCADPCAGEEDCPAGYTCQSSMVPTDSGTVTLDVCVPEGAPCLNDSDCAGNDVCVVDRSADLVLSCGDSVGQAGVGETCTDDSDCANNLCLGGTCSAPCEAPNDCGDAGSTCDSTTVATGNGDAELNACVPRTEGTCLSDADCAGGQRCVAQKTATDLIFTCGSGNSGGGETGATCTTDTDCAQNLCDSGTCVGPCQSTGDCSAADNFACETRNVDLGNGNSDSASICTPPTPCAEDDDCRVGEVCYVNSNGGVVDTFCREPNNGGGELGQVCTDDTACANNLCGDTRFRDVCLVPCADTSDCTENGFVCGTVDVDGTSVSACVADTSTACTSDDDCGTGTNCAIIENVAGDGLEAVCVPSTGGSPTGVMCTADSDCSSLVCLNDRCAAPCDDSNQCANNQICNTNTVAKNSLSGDFDVCETLPVTVCSSTDDCTDGVRVCGLIQSQAGTADAYCTFPNDPPAAQLGTSCARDNDCRENVCLQVSDECSVVCDDDMDCGTGQICTAYSVPNNTLGFCNRGCTNNTDCQNGNVCTINSNTIDNTVDQVCENVVGAKDLGDSCASGSECITGICLTTSIFRQGASCTTDANCNAGEVCKCPIDQPNCTTGRECATEEQACTRLCDTANGTADCVSSFAGNRLTVCSTDTVVSLPDNSGVVNVATCSAPN
jgi:hypothetical protein